MVFAAAFTVARGQEETIARAKAQAPRVKAWGGWILVTVGIWFLVLATFAEFFADIFPV